MVHKIQPKINLEVDESIYSYKLFESLILLEKNNSQRKTAKKLNISHSVLNRRIKKAEENLGYDLVKVVGSKTHLNNEAIKLIEKYQRYQAQVAENKKIVIGGGHIIAGFLDSIESELPFEIEVYGSADINAYHLAKRGIIDILALDDPQIAFIRDLDFIPIAYDHLVLVSSDNSKNDKIETLNDLNNLKFISVHGTAQRLAWDTLYKNKIHFNIVKEVKSEFDAFKIVKNSKNYYTFLNASYFKGNDVLKEQTQHVLSLIPINNEKKGVNELIEYILNEGQKLVAKEGFLAIKPWKIKEY